MRIAGAVLMLIGSMMLGCGAREVPEEVQVESCRCAPGCSGCRGDCGAASQPACAPGATGSETCYTCQCDTYHEPCELPAPCAPGLIACASDCDDHVYCTTSALCAYCKRRSLCAPPTCP
jgi:hypothetical protein